jgi:hypothetical protein
MKYGLKRIPFKNRFTEIPLTGSCYKAKNAGWLFNSILDSGALPPAPSFPANEWLGQLRMARSGSAPPQVVVKW